VLQLPAALKKQVQGSAAEEKALLRRLFFSLPPSCFPPPSDKRLKAKVPTEILFHCTALFERHLCPSKAQRQDERAPQRK